MALSPGWNFLGTVSIYASYDTGIREYKVKRAILANLSTYPSLSKVHHSPE
jgi:hypothetical protein